MNNKQKQPAKKISMDGLMKLKRNISNANPTTDKLLPKTKLESMRMQEKMKKRMKNIFSTLDLEALGQEKKQTEGDNAATKDQLHKKMYSDKLDFLVPTDSKESLGLHGPSPSL